MTANSVLDIDDDLPLSVVALQLVSVCLAALPWAEDTREPGEPRPRKTVEEKAIGKVFRYLFQTARMIDREREEDIIRERLQEYDALNNGLRAIVCKMVGVEYGEVEIPDLPDDLFTVIEAEAEAQADPADSEEVRAQKIADRKRAAHMEAMNLTNRAIWDGNTRRQFVTGSNRVSEHLAA
ncbi:MAG: hypothetical protein V4671_22455 [Armatimonadota bacterium]